VTADGQTTPAAVSAEVSTPPVPYEAPALVEIGSVHELTLSGRGRCFWGKKWGGSDGLEWMGINIPVSSC
jgi:hypothetical protein